LLHRLRIHVFCVRAVPCAAFVVRVGVACTLRVLVCVVALAGDGGDDSTDEELADEIDKLHRQRRREAKAKDRGKHLMLENGTTTSVRAGSKQGTLRLGSPSKTSGGGGGGMHASVPDSPFKGGGGGAAAAVDTDAAPGVDGGGGGANGSEGVHDAMLRTKGEPMTAEQEAEKAKAVAKTKALAAKPHNPNWLVHIPFSVPTFANI